MFPKKSCKKLCILRKKNSTCFLRGHFPFFCFVFQFVQIVPFWTYIRFGSTHRSLICFNANNLVFLGISRWLENCDNSVQKMIFCRKNNFSFLPCYFGKSGKDRRGWVCLYEVGWICFWKGRTKWSGGRDLIKSTKKWWVS